MLIKATVVVPFAAVLMLWPDASRAQAGPTLSPATINRVGTVDERYQSYNIEMLEVTGGKFWRPYNDLPNKILKAGSPAPKAGGDAPAGMSPDLYQYRPPLDLANRRLRMLAGALSPA